MWENWGGVVRWGYVALSRQAAPNALVQTKNWSGTSTQQRCTGKHEGRDSRVALSREQKQTLESKVKHATKKWWNLITDIM